MAVTQIGSVSPPFCVTTTSAKHGLQDPPPGCVKSCLTAIKFSRRMAPDHSGDPRLLQMIRNDFRILRQLQMMQGISQMPLYAPSSNLSQVDPEHLLRGFRDLSKTPPWMFGACIWYISRKCEFLIRYYVWRLAALRGPQKEHAL